MSEKIKAIVMPKWGMEMVEGTVSDWYVEEGVYLDAGADVVDIETSKIVNTVQAHEGGLLRRRVAQSGQTLAVGALLAVMAEPDVSDDAIKGFIETFVATAPIPEQDIVEDEQQDPAIESATQEQEDLSAVSESNPHSANSVASAVRASPVAARLAVEYGLAIERIHPTGRNGRVSKHDVEAAAKASGMAIRTAHANPQVVERMARDDSRVKATPIARRLASEHGINLLDCRSSGTHGRVSKSDVEALISRASGSLPTTQNPVATEARSIPLSKMRRRIAERLQQSKRDAPHFRLQRDCCVDQMMQLRQQLNGRQESVKVSLNDFFTLAVGRALISHPALNVQFDGQDIQQYSSADISLAVALEDGLITPVLRGVDSKGLLQVAQETKDLVARARDGRLNSDDVSGGTFTISNLGGFGVKRFDAIINPPQVAILAVGAATPTPVVVENEVRVASVVSVCLSLDHRVIDGAVGAAFLATLADYLENPALMIA